MTRHKEHVLYRLSPCGCGCGGRDPWHKSQYLRHVAKTSETEGTVRLPMSSKPVRVTRTVLGLSDFTGRTLYGAWVVDRDSLVYDK